MKTKISIKELEKHLDENPDDARSLFELGMLYLESEDYGNAILKMEESINLSPVNNQAHLILGIAYSLSKKFESATSHWEKMIDEDGNFFTGDRGSINPSYISMAKASWNEYKKETPESSISIFKWSFANLVLGFYDQAIDGFTIAINANPDIARARFYRGLCRYLAGDYQNAANDFQGELVRYPECLDCIYYQGLAFMEQGKTAQAIEQFNNILARIPHHQKARYQLGCAFASLGNYAKAVEIFEHALDFNPRFIQVYFQLGQVYEKQYLMDKAITQYELAVQLEPDFKMANFRLGMLNKNLGKLETALKYLKKTVKLDPDDGDAHYCLGLIYLSQSEYDEAISKFRESLRVNPDYAPAFYSLGISYFHQGKIKESIFEYQKALQLDPRDFQTHKAIGMAYLKTQDLEKASFHFNEALAANPHDPSIYFNLGTINFQNRDFPKTIEAFKKTVEFGTSEIFQHYTRGALLSRSYKFDQAIHEFQSAAGKTPSGESDLSMFASLHLISTIALEQAWENASLNSKCNQTQERINGLARMISKLVDEWVPDSDQHSERVAQIATVIAKQFGYSDKEIEEIHIAGLLHDIGKLKIERQILLKDLENMSDDEREQLYSHPHKSFNLIWEIPECKNIASIVLYHHERYDGKGFPENLRGEAIPRAAQILSIANHLDNLLHRKKIKITEAMDQIMDERFKMFSSDVINTFLSVVDDLMMR